MEQPSTQNGCGLGGAGVPDGPRAAVVPGGQRGPGLVHVEAAAHHVRELPHMTSNQKRGGGLNFADKQNRLCKEKGGRGKKSPNYVDVIYGSPLSQLPGAPDGARAGGRGAVRLALRAALPVSAMR